MTSFIQSVLEDLKQKNLNFEDLHFILPSKRAGVFLKHYISTQVDAPIFSPHILSIEEFVEDLSGLQNLPNIDLLFRLYESYSTLTNKKDLEAFDSFSKWAQILLQDFNEIDRYLISQDQIFDYLNAIEELKHWSLESEQTEFIKKHLKFWNRLKDYYSEFTENLLRNKQGYQGLIYREATENLEVYIENNSDKKHIFMGFNALNQAESQIIQGLVQSDLASIYWDIDETFINDELHDAGLFTRYHRNSWKVFKKQPFNWVTSNYKQAKKVNVIGIPKLVGQAKYIGNLLKEISVTNPKLSSVAVVLGEENLLIPVLNSIPREIDTLNVTMGLPLKQVPLASFFELLLSNHKNNPKSYYYKDVISILTHPSVYGLFDNENNNEAREIVNVIQNKNLVYITIDDLRNQLKSYKELIDLLFKPWNDNAATALKNCSSLIFKIKATLDIDKVNFGLELEYLHRFNTLFNKLSELNNTYSYINSISTLQSLFNELLSSETLDFRGEPLEGLQIMGMLESRVLDFETVIISSVNEGILPSGKSNNSFIPFDVKVDNNLPTYKEKDAVYTYHFYRLLQRAKHIYILYNTEIDVLKGGEKSRFITQLEIEGIHDIHHTIVSPEVPVLETSLQHISKNDMVLEKIKKLSNNGFSPSSLSNYIRNPIDFYYEKILGVKEFQDVEENIAANTLGSVIHNTLEDFYKPIEGKLLSIDDLNTFKKQITPTVTKHFNLLYNEGNFSTGKNLIIFEIAKRYISNFINIEIESLRQGNKIEIIDIEADEIIDFNIAELNFTIKLKGKVDRIDKFNGTTRVIDYKSGKVEQSKVELINWEDLTTDYEKYSKSFQILCYTYMLHKNNRIQLPVEAGIISFKNLNSGFLKFAVKDKPGAYANKQQLITEDTLLHFENELKNLIIEICNSEIDFIEKDVS